MPSKIVDEALGGLSAGIIGTVIGYPLDVVKTQMQTSSQTGILATGRRIVRTEGFRAMYRGVGPPLVSLSFLNTMSFASYSYFQLAYGAQRTTWDWKNAAAGASVGPLSSCVSTVENMVKTQMQVDRGGSKTFASSWDCFKKLLATRNQYNIPGAVIYTGHGVNTIREVSFLMTYFYIYEGLRHEIAQASTATPTKKIPHWVIPIAGGCSGATAWFLTFPLDCIRAGVQGQTKLDQPRTAKQIFQSLMTAKGITGLYAGVRPSIARAFIVSATRFSAYEGTLWLLRGGRDAP